MDATGTERAVLVSLSRGAERSLHLAASHPERVDKLVFIAPGPAAAAGYPAPEGDAGVQRAARRRTSAGRSGTATTGSSTTRTSSSSSSRSASPSRTRRSSARTASAGASRRTPRRWSRPSSHPGSRTRRACASCSPASSCPVLVIHGSDDAVRPCASGARLAELANGALTVLEGSGHLPHARDPVKVNLLLRDFIEPAPPPRRWVRGKSRRKRALYVSSPIGLGHAQRDAAIADELRKLHPDLEIDWLAQHPVTAVLEARGERIHPASALPRQRVASHRERVGRARPALLPGDPADGRDPALQLHGLPRPRARGAVRPLDRRRGLGARLLPAREPRAEADALRVADRLRRLAADARRRRPRGVPDRRLQRGDDRAHRALPARARSGRLRRQPRGHRARAVRVAPPRDPRVDPGALLVRRLRHGLRPCRVRRPRRPQGRARLRRGRAGLHRHGRRLGGRRRSAAAGDRRLPGGEEAGAGAADDRRRRARGSTRRRCPRTTGSRFGPTSISSTGTSPPAISPSSRAA